MIDGRVFNPCSIQDHLSEEQIIRFATLLAEWDGQLVEPVYTEGISSTQLNVALKDIGVTPDVRRARLRRLLGAKPLVRMMEAHNGLTGLIVEKTQVHSGGKLPHCSPRRIDHGDRDILPATKIKLDHTGIRQRIRCAGMQCEDE